jgi:hypothetical protein
MVFVVSAGTKTDTLYTSGGAYLTRLSTPSAGITRANIDTSKTRHATADSATIPIFKGAKTFRDTTTFTGGAYFAGIGRFAGTLIAPVAKIDSLTSRLKVGGDISAYNVADNCYMYSTSTCGTIYTGSSKAGGASFHAGIADAMKILASGNYPLVISHNNNQPIIFGTNDIERGKIYGNGNVEFAGALTTTTLNTGNGDNELYPMNQDVRTTASPTFVNVTSNLTGIADSAKKAGTATNVSGGTVDATTGTFSGAVQGKTFNSGLGATEIPVYTSGTFNCSLLVSDVTSMQYGTAHYEKIGNKVTITFPAMTSTSKSTNLTIYFGSAFTTYNIIPIGWTTTFPALTVDNDNTKQEYFIYNKSISYNYINAMSSYANSGTKGYWYDFTITYIAQ